jgi:hypothetical protein
MGGGGGGEREREREREREKERETNSSGRIVRLAFQLSLLGETTLC